MTVRSESFALTPFLPFSLSALSPLQLPHLLQDLVRILPRRIDVIQYHPRPVLASVIDGDIAVAEEPLESVL